MIVRARSPLVAGALAAAASMWIGCNKPADPLKITAIELGPAITADKTVHAPAETYAPGSTVYGSIATEGGGSGTLTARWTGADGQVFAEQKQTINPTKPTHFEFHYAPAGGWPVGRHKVVFMLDGGGARTREFEIR